MRTKEQAMVEMLMGKRFFYSGRVAEYCKRSGEFLLDVGTENEKIISGLWNDVANWEEYLGPHRFNFEPFDRVCVIDENESWKADIFSHVELSGFICVGGAWDYVTDFNPVLLGVPKEATNPGIIIWEVFQGDPIVMEDVLNELKELKNEHN